MVKNENKEIDQNEYAKALLGLSGNLLKKKQGKTIGEELNTRMVWRCGRFWPEEWPSRDSWWKILLFIIIVAILFGLFDLL
ncbi:MAG: hypothetical protein WCO05_01535 [Candidatus Moraniibacteriota bacterium]